MDIKALILSCQTNQKDAFKNLFDNLAPRLMTTARRYVDKNQADDILQESFIQIFKSINNIDLNKINNGSYFHKVVVNNCLKAIRKKKLILNTEKNSAPELIVTSTNLDSLSIDEILALVNKLPYSAKVCFSLYEIDGFNHKEIGEKLGISESTSRAHLTRAKKQLVKMINQLEYNDKKIIVS